MGRNLQSSSRDHISAAASARGSSGTRSSCTQKTKARKWRQPDEDLVASAECTHHGATIQRAHPTSTAACSNSTNSSNSLLCRVIVSTGDGFRMEEFMENIGKKRWTKLDQEEIQAAEWRSRQDGEWVPWRPPQKRPMHPNAAVHIRPSRKPQRGLLPKPHHPTTTTTTTTTATCSASASARRRRRRRRRSRSHRSIKRKRRKSQACSSSSATSASKGSSSSSSEHADTDDSDANGLSTRTKRRRTDSGDAECIERNGNATKPGCGLSGPSIRQEKGGSDVLR